MIIVNDKHVTVVDFKTGKWDYGKKKVSPPVSLEDNPEESNFEKRYGGDYWRQVLFYKALIESDTSENMKVTTGEIDFIEPDKEGFHKSKIMVTDDHYDFVKKQIKSTYQRIQQLEFDKGCEEQDCQWCNFNASAKKQAVHNESH